MDKFIEPCMICNLECSTIKSLSRHINITHKITSEEYYIKYLNNSRQYCKCGNPCTFISISKGYHTFCSAKCSVNDITVKQKKDTTCLKKYGVVNVSVLNITKAKVIETSMKKYGTITPLLNHKIKEKTHKTLIEKYGVDNIFKSATIKERIKINCQTYYGVDHNTQREDIKKNRINTYFNKYGVLHPMKSVDILDKRKQTCKEKYGVDVAASNIIVKENIIKANMKKYGVSSYFKTDAMKQLNKMRYKNEAHIKYDDLFSKFKCELIDSELHSFTYLCTECNSTVTEGYLFATRCRIYKNITPCSICIPKPLYTSFKERELSNYIKTITSHDVILNTRDIISPYELDVYIPSSKVAFEFNGLYHHNELHKSNDYHLNKTNMCEANGIKLIHIFEDDWIYKQDIVKSRINNILGKSIKIFARKCIIMPVSSIDSSKFLSENHLQGKCRSLYRYGLYYNNILVSLMTFGKGRFSNDIELIRFCNKLNITVVGGAGKLFTYFTKHNQVDTIISYADRCWSNGNLYESIGFTFNSITPPNYYYVNGDIRENRMKYQKHKLIKAGYDHNKTERDIMLDREIYRIYDSGNLKYIWNR